MTITVSLPGGVPKRQIVELAFESLGMAGYEFGRTPEESGSALVMLNALMQEWPFSGLGYVQPTYGNGSADELSGIEAQFTNAVAAALSVRLAPSFGVSLSPEAQGNVANSKRLLAAQLATVPRMPMAAHTPRGAGVRIAFGPFIEERDVASVPDVVIDVPPLPSVPDEDPGDLAAMI